MEIIIFPSNGPTRCRISSEEILGTQLCWTHFVSSAARTRSRTQTLSLPGYSGSLRDSLFWNPTSVISAKDFIKLSPLTPTKFFISSSTSCKMGNVFGASLQQLKTALTAKIDNEEMKQVVSKCPTMAPFCSDGERNSEMMTLSHINLSIKSHDGLKKAEMEGGQVWLWPSSAGRHLQPSTDGRSLSPHLSADVRGLHASFSHTSPNSTEPRSYVYTCCLRV